MVDVARARGAPVLHAPIREGVEVVPGSGPVPPPPGGPVQEWADTRVSEATPLVGVELAGTMLYVQCDFANDP